MSRFSVSLTERQIRESSVRDLEDELIDAADERIDRVDTTPIKPFLESDFPLRELCRWANDKFELGLDSDELYADKERGITLPAAQIVERMEQQARTAYRRREIEYPVDHTLNLVSGGQPSIADANAAAYLREWAKLKYGLDLTLEEIQNRAAGGPARAAVGRAGEVHRRRPPGRPRWTRFWPRAATTTTPSPSRSWQGSACR